MQEGDFCGDSYPQVASSSDFTSVFVVDPVVSWCRHYMGDLIYGVPPSFELRIMPPLKL